MPHQVILKISFLTQRFPNQDHIHGRYSRLPFASSEAFCILWTQQRSSFLPCMHASPQCHPIRILPHELTFKVTYCALPLTFHSPFFFTFFITSCMISKKEKKRKEGRKEGGKTGGREGRKEEKRFNVISRTSNPCL